MSEKRYFKIFSERHTIGEQNKYVALFDELDKASEENDIELKKNLKKIGVIVPLRKIGDFHLQKLMQKIPTGMM